jgi:tetratricopeptide (TPR) repeat protein
VNLLAAGALTFPGVIVTLLVLLPLACFTASQQARQATADSAILARAAALPRPLSLPRTAIILTSLGAAVLMIACLATEYLPVLHGRLAVAQALYLLQAGEGRQAEDRAMDAARADTLSPEPWRLLTELRLSQWLVTGDQGDRAAFDEAADAYRSRDPRHHLAWYGRGNWYLTAWRKSARQEDLEQALSAYTQASIHYPQRAFYHAQLAWVLHLAGQDDLACQSAQKAIDLDDQMPHQEQKLRRQKIIDPELTPAGAKLPRDESAEQTALRLRIISAEKMP